MIDLIIIGIVVACVVFSIAYSIKKKKSGQTSCGHSCSQCDTSSSCSGGNQ